MDAHHITGTPTGTVNLTLTGPEIPLFGEGVLSSLGVAAEMVDAPINWDDFAPSRDLAWLPRISQLVNALDALHRADAQQTSAQVNLAADDIAEAIKVAVEGARDDLANAARSAESVALEAANEKLSVALALRAQQGRVGD